MAQWTSLLNKIYRHTRGTSRGWNPSRGTQSRHSQLSTSSQKPPKQAWFSQFVQKYGSWLGCGHLGNTTILNLQSYVLSQHQSTESKRAKLVLQLYAMVVMGMHTALLRTALSTRLGQLHPRLGTISSTNSSLVSYPDLSLTRPWLWERGY